MKTFTKFLSMLMVVVMCLSLFGASAYAGGLGAFSEGGEFGQGEVGLGSFGGGESGQSEGGLGAFEEPGYTEPTYGEPGYTEPVYTEPETEIGGLGSLGEGTGEGGGLAQLPETQEEPFDFEESLVFNSAAGVIATVGTVGCKTIEEINKALANGGTLTLVDNISGTIIINRSSVVDLNGKKLTGTFQVYAPLTIKDSVGSGEVVGSTPLNVLNGGSVSVMGGTFAKNKVTLYIASGYMLDPSETTKDKVIPKGVASATAIALVNGQDCYSAADLAQMLAANATVVLNQNFTGDITFHAGGSLDLNGYTLTGSINTYGNLSISDRQNSGNVTGTVNNLGSGTVSITGGGFTTAPNSAFIASGYTYSGGRVVPFAQTSIARIGNTYYAAFADAIAAARDGDTIVFLERTDLSSANYGDWTITGKKNLTVQLGSNGLNNVTVNNSSVTFVGGFIDSLVVQNNSNVNLNGTRVGSIVKDESSTIGESGAGGSGGSGGSGGGSGGGYNPGSYNVGNNPYYKGSGNATYFYTLYSNTFNGYAYSTDYAGTNYRVLREYFEYTLNNGNLVLSEDFLEGLNVGTYYMWGLTYNAAGSIVGAQRVASFTVKNAEVPETNTWWLTPNHSVWYSSNDPLVFQSNLMRESQRNTSPGKTTGVNAIIRYGTNSSMWPSKSLTVEQYWDLGEREGYFMLGRNFLNSLSAEETYYMQIIDANAPNVNYTNVVSFRVGPTLRAIDTDKHVINSTRNLRFRSSDVIQRVYVGNIELTDEADFGISWDGKTVTLSYEFLNKRTPGNTYSIRVRTPSGDASTTFQILTTAQGSASPRTGDESNIGLWSAFLLLSGTAIVVLVPKLRKHEL